METELEELLNKNTEFLKQLLDNQKSIIDLIDINNDEIIDVFVNHTNQEMNILQGKITVSKFSMFMYDKSKQKLINLLDNSIDITNIIYIPIKNSDFLVAVYQKILSNDILSNKSITIDFDFQIRKYGDGTMKYDSLVIMPRNYILANNFIRDNLKNI